MSHTSARAYSRWDVQGLRDKGNVSDGVLPTDEPLLLAEHAFEDAKHADDLFAIAL